MNNQVQSLVKAEVFIIPNMPVVYGGEDNEYTNKSIENKMAKFGYTPKDGERFFQVWTVSPDRPEDKPEEWSENWADHGMPKIIADQFMWPSFLPASLLPTNEGESTVISTENNSYELTAAQSKYRYGRFGTFEEVAANLSSKCK